MLLLEDSETRSRRRMRETFRDCMAILKTSGKKVAILPYKEVHMPSDYQETIDKVLSERGGSPVLTDCPFCVMEVRRKELPPLTAAHFKFELRKAKIPHGPAH